MVKEYKCSELAELVNGKASSNNIVIDNISSLESANDSSISFLSDASYIPKLSVTKSKVILIKQDDLNIKLGINILLTAIVSKIL